MAKSYSKFMPALKQRLPESEVTALGRATGFIRRLRTVSAADFVWAVVLSRFSTGIPGFDHARRIYEDITGLAIWPRPFQKRFLTGAAVGLFARAFNVAVSKWKERRRIEHPLAKHFTDIVAIDSTIIQLNDGLRRRFPGHMKAAAELKATVAISVFGLVPLMARLTSRKKHDTKLFPRLSMFQKGSLLLFDTAYTDYGRLSNIGKDGLYYVAPMRIDGAPRVTKVHLGPKRVKKQVDAAMQRSGDVSRPGVPLPELLRKNARVGKTWDLDVQLYPRSGDSTSARLVILPARARKGRNSPKKSLMRLTNVARDWSAQAVDELYRLRWQIENVFKELKQDLSLESAPTKDANAAQVLVWASLIALAVSRTIATALIPLSKLNGVAAEYAPGQITKAVHGCIESLIRFFVRAPSARGVQNLLEALAKRAARRRSKRVDSFQQLALLAPA